MPPKSDSVEGIVLGFVNEQNRPLNSQNVADALQKFNLKKTAVQKALDALADSGQISFKEYGKQKIYIARQDQFDIPNGEELEEMKKKIAKLQEELVDQKKAISEVESEVRGLQSNLTLAEITSKETKLQSDSQFTIDMNADPVKEAFSDLLKKGQRQMRYRLKKKYFDGVPANQVRTTSPLTTMTDSEWMELVGMWSTPKHREKCLKAKDAREQVQYHQMTGSRSYVAQCYVMVDKV